MFRYIAVLIIPPLTVLAEVGDTIRSDDSICETECSVESCESESRDETCDLAEQKEDIKLRIEILGDGACKSTGNLSYFPGGWAMFSLTYQNAKIASQESKRIECSGLYKLVVPRGFKMTRTFSNSMWESQSAGETDVLRVSTDISFQKPLKFFNDSRKIVGEYKRSSMFKTLDIELSACEGNEEVYIIRTKQILSVYNSVDPANGLILSRTIPKGITFYFPTLESCAVN